MAVGMYRLGADTADELPHPPIPLAVFLVVEEALLKTWGNCLAPCPCI